MYNYLNPKYKPGCLKMLENIHIREPKLVYEQIMKNRGLFISYDQGGMIPNSSVNQSDNQFGGGVKKEEYMFENKKFIIYKAKSDTGGYDILIQLNFVSGL